MYCTAAAAAHEKKRPLLAAQDPASYWHGRRFACSGARCKAKKSVLPLTYDAIVMMVRMMMMLLLRRSGGGGGGGGLGWAGCWVQEQE